MSLKYGVLSFLIFCAVLLLGLKNYEIWTQPIEWAPKKSMGKKSEIKPEIKTEVSSTAGAQKDPSSVKSYIAIAGKNIFSPERKDFPLPMVEAIKPLVRPQIVLYGVTIAGNYQAASVTNPGRPVRKGERETMTLKIGDKVGEYTLAKIFSDRISLEAPGDTFEVLLYDARMPKKRTEVKTETKPAAVTSALPGPAPASPPATTQPAPPAAASTARPTPPVVATPPPVATPPAPTQVPRPTLPTRRGRMMYYPPSGTPATPGTTPVTPATPAPVQGTEEN